jgi:hypothetical protein
VLLAQHILFPGFRSARPQWLGLLIFGGQFYTDGLLSSICKTFCWQELKVVYLAITRRQRQQKGSSMFTPKQYRAKAAEYAELAKTASRPNELREYQDLERTFAVLAENEQWMRDNYDKTLHATELIG